MDAGTVIPERQRAGVIHWGLGVTLHHDPGVRTQSVKLLEFTKQYNLPKDHGFHTHTYFSDYQVHLRNADRWVTLIVRQSRSAPHRGLAAGEGVIDRVLAGNYDHFYPLTAGQKSGPRPTEH